MDQNGLIEELKLQALYDFNGAIALGAWCELPAEALDEIRAWANPPERSAAWDRREPLGNRQSANQGPGGLATANPTPPRNAS